MSPKRTALRALIAALAVITILQVPTAAYAQPHNNYRDQHYQETQRRWNDRQNWNAHQRSAQRWHRNYRYKTYYHYDEPAVVYAPPPVVYTPPLLPSALTFIFPLDIR